jgi:hypothetical protein
MKDKEPRLCRCVQQVFSACKTVEPKSTHRFMQKKGLKQVLQIKATQLCGHKIMRRSSFFSKHGILQQSTYDGRLIVRVFNIYYGLSCCYVLKITALKKVR